VCTHFSCRGNLPFAFHDSNDVASHCLSYMNEHQADRPTTDYRNGIADLNARFMEPAQDTRQWFNHRSFFVAYVRWNNERVQVNDSAGNTNVFCVRAIIEEKIFAEILLMT